MGRSGLERLVEWLRRDPGTLASIGTALALPAIPLAVWGGQYRWLALVLPFVALLPVAVGRLLRISRKALDDAVTAVLGGTGIVAILLAIFWSGERWLAVVPGALRSLVIYSDTLARCRHVSVRREDDASASRGGGQRGSTGDRRAERRAGGGGHPVPGVQAKATR